MNPKLHEDVLFGHADSPEIGRCAICGRAVDTHRRHCLRCANLKLEDGDMHRPPRRPIGGLILLLVLLLTAAAVQYRRTAKIQEADDQESERAPAEFFAEAADAEPVNQPLTGDRHAPVKSSPAISTATSGQRNRQPPEQRAPVRATPPPTASTLTTVTITCPACEGRGRLANPPPRKGSYTCPVCTGSGKRIRRFLASRWKLCEPCKGMGAQAGEDDLFRTRNRITRVPCPECAGKGIVLLQANGKAP